MMDRADSLHSRVVLWLKIALPLMALALLSTVFLFSRAMETGQSLPIVPDIEKRVAEQQITLPQYSGVTDRGDMISVTADQARPNDDGATATRVQARINASTGSMVTLGAETADLLQSDALAHFRGNVNVDSSAGYQIGTEHLVSRLDELHVESLTPVTGDGPAGRFSAGKMLIHVPDPDGGVQMLFTEGVNLVYEP